MTGVSHRIREEALRPEGIPTESVTIGAADLTGATGELKKIRKIQENAISENTIPAKNDRKISRKM